MRLGRTHSLLCSLPRVVQMDFHEIPLTSWSSGRALASCSTAESARNERIRHIPFQRVSGNILKLRSHRERVRQRCSVEADFWEDLMEILARAWGFCSNVTRPSREFWSAPWSFVYFFLGAQMLPSKSQRDFMKRDTFLRAKKNGNQNFEFGPCFSWFLAWGYRTEKFKDLRTSVRKIGGK